MCTNVKGTQHRKKSLQVLPYHSPLLLSPLPPYLLHSSLPYWIWSDQFSESQDSWWFAFLLLSQKGGTTVHRSLLSPGDGVAVHTLPYNAGSITERVSTALTHKAQARNLNVLGWGLDFYIWSNINVRSDFGNISERRMGWDDSVSRCTEARQMSFCFLQYVDLQLENTFH